MPKVALIIGHTPSSPGACNNESGLCEYRFNAPLAADVQSLLGVDSVIVERNTYERLPADVNATGADIAVSMHANAGPGPASGSEVLHWHSSTDGATLAACLQSQFLEALDLSDRGTKPRRFGDRGGHLLGRTSMPCVICEPFFIDNDTDLQRAIDRKQSLARAYATGIQQHLQSHVV